MIILWGQVHTTKKWWSQNLSNLRLVVSTVYAFDHFLYPRYISIPSFNSRYKRGKSGIEESNVHTGTPTFIAISIVVSQHYCINGYYQQYNR